MAGKNGGTGIPLLLCRVPELLVAGQVHMGLSLFHLGFLEADEVRIQPQN